MSHLGPRGDGQDAGGAGGPHGGGEGLQASVCDRRGRREPGKPPSDGAVLRVGFIRGQQENGLKNGSITWL